MVSSATLAICCVLCVAVVPLARADYCKSYVDGYGVRHNSQQCGMEYCCGDCNRKYCCGDYRYQITEQEQNRCSDRPTLSKPSRIATILGSVLGSLLPILFCVGLVICCVAPCCYCYKKCRKGNRQPTTPNTIVIPPRPHAGPSGPQPPYPGQQPYPGHPTYPGYQPVPGFGLHSASAPPSYMESTQVPAAFTEGQPSYPLQPPQSNELAQPPFNPSYEKS
ncbi:unnamed protein product [Ophioblennius macclurei]